MRGLRAYLRSCEGRAFAYGRHDCALFAAGWVKAATGRDLTLGIRYASLREGREKLAAAGFADHVAVAAALLPEVPVLAARGGDVAVIGAVIGDALGIVTGERVAVIDRRGIGYLPLTMATRAFRVI